MLYKLVKPTNNFSGFIDNKFLQITAYPLEPLGDYELSKGEYDAACQAFTDTYSVKIENRNFNYDFSIDAREFKKIITEILERVPDLNLTNNKGLSRLGLKFVHAYDPLKRHWFLKMRACKLEIADDADIADISGQPVNIVHFINTASNNEGYILRDTGPISEIANIPDMDNDYFDNFLYDNMPIDTSVPPGGLRDKCVRYGVFSFMEILHLFCDNHINFFDDSLKGIRIKFSSCSFDNPGVDEIRWPHAIAILLDAHGIRLLTEHIVTNGDLKNCAADYGTMHPPKNSNIHIFPHGIKKTIPGVNCPQ